VLSKSEVLLRSDFMCLVFNLPIVCVCVFFYRFRSKSYSNEAMNKLWEHTNRSDENVLVRGRSFMKKASWNNECGGTILWNTEIGYRHVQVIFSSDMDRYVFSAKLCAWMYVTLMRNAAENECSLDETFLKFNLLSTLNIKIFFRNLAVGLLLNS